MEYKGKHKTMPNNLHIYVLHLCIHVPVTTMAIIANKLINSNLVLYVTLTPNILISPAIKLPQAHRVAHLPLSEYTFTTLSYKPSSVVYCQMGASLRSIINNKNYVNDISKCFVFLFNKDVKFCSNPGFPASLFA